MKEFLMRSYKFDIRIHFDILYSLFGIRHWDFDDFYIRGHYLAGFSPR
jgi:hypothetical protein